MRQEIIKGKGGGEWVREGGRENKPGRKENKEKLRKEGQTKEVKHLENGK